MIAIFKKEFLGYFRTPLAYIFLIIFLIVSMGSTFYIGNFFARGQADLISFFAILPWVFLFFIPGICMKLWSEEFSSQTAELLLTLPISTIKIILGKFFAAWLFIGIALFATFPLWITVSYLGNPDHIIILWGYFCGFLMAGSFVAIGSFVSAITKSQAISFVLGVFISLIFIVSGTQMALSFMQNIVPEAMIYSFLSLSFLNYFELIAKGIIPVSAFIFYFSVMGLFLFLNILFLEKRKVA